MRGEVLSIGGGVHSGNVLWASALHSGSGVRKTFLVVVGVDSRHTPGKDPFKSCTEKKNKKLNYTRAVLSRRSS